MKAFVVLLLGLSGCASLTENQRRALQIGGAVLVAGAIAAAVKDRGDPKTLEPVGLPCRMQPDGSCR